ncbi:MAG: UDP-N-acetylmuramate dehydrogenase [Clostridia bacterium]|nr:UDP-N-acetylmuramate dehydrogenase [Clostridia bacterium]
MREFTSFRAGGKASVLVTAENTDELGYIFSCIGEFDADYIFLGNGSNILVRDGGFEGLILKLGNAFSKITVSGNTIRAGAAALLSSVSREAQANSLTGFEFASGIPGSVGGALFMNAGAYDGEISQVVKSASVRSADGKIITLQPKNMDFSYRHSRFQTGEEIVLEAEFELSPGNPDEILAKMKELAAKRNSKQPVQLPSAGSFFKRPPGNFAGKLIQDAGLKGLSVGDAQVSPLHAGFIVNNGHATASDITKLMGLVQNTVYDRFGVMLEPEVRIIGKE